MDMDISANTINIQTDIKDTELEDKCWSQLPAAPYTVTNAEGLLNHMMAWIPLNEAKRVDRGIFQVFYTGDI
jgi:hypothetical protein